MENTGRGCSKREPEQDRCLIQRCRQTTLARVQATTTPRVLGIHSGALPFLAGLSIRLAFRESNLFSERNFVLVHRAHEVSMAYETAPLATPLTAIGLVAMAANRTPARGTSFRPGEALDAGLLGFVLQVVDVSPVLPLGQALVMVVPTPVLAHTLWVTDIKRTDAIGNAEIYDLPSGLVAHIADTTFLSNAHLSAGTLQFLPAARAFATARALLGDASELLREQAFLGTEATAANNQTLAGVGGDSGQMYLAEVHGSTMSAWHLFGEARLEGDVCLVGFAVPKNFAGAGCFEPFRTIEDHRRTPATHRQGDLPLFDAHRLRGPHERVERLVLIRVAHLLESLFAPLAGSLHVGKKGVANHLSALGMQSELPFRGLLQRVPSRPACVFFPRLQVQIAANAPYLGGLDLALTQYSLLLPWQAGKSMYTNRLHKDIIAELWIPCNRVKHAGHTTRLPTTWYGCRSTGANCSSEKWSKRSSGTSLRRVSITAFNCLRSKPISITFMCSYRRRHGGARPLSSACSKAIRRESCGQNSHSSRKCAARTSYGHKPITWGLPDKSRRKLFAGIYNNARGRKAEFAFIPRLKPRGIPAHGF
jgi:hypothetical protein